MRLAPALIAAVATLLLHMTMIAVVAFGLPTGLHISPPGPIAIRVVPAEAQVSKPIAKAPPLLPSSSREEPQPPRPRPEPAPERKPAPKPAPERRPAAEARTEAQESAPVTQAPALDSLPTPDAAANASPAPPPVPPSKTSVSIASYAASNRKPSYPRMSRLNNEQGTVVLRVLVTAQGTASAVEIDSSSGYPLLDDSARAAVRSWRFSPATIDGKPVAEWYRIPIPFTLQNN